MGPIQAIRMFLWRLGWLRNSPKPECIQAIREATWRQGSFLPKPLAEELVGYCEPRLAVDLTQREWFLVVASQDCDVVNWSFEAEPWVEVLLVVRPEKEDGNLFRLRNPRRLQFFGLQFGNQILLEAYIHHRFRLPREFLAKGVPERDMALTPEHLSYLVRWLARRYRRSALPDAFNNRMKDYDRKIKKLLTRYPSAVDQILIVLDPWEELPQEGTYRLSIVATLVEADYADDTKIRCAEEVLMQLEEILSDVPGVDIVSGPELRSEADVSLADLRSYKVWDFESISLSDEEIG